MVTQEDKTSTSTITTSKGVSIMKHRKTYLLLILIVLIGVFSAFFFLKPAALNFSIQKDAGQTLTYPIDPNNTFITSKALIYSFMGEVNSLKEVTEGLVLVTNIKGANIPEFLVTKKTLVVKQDSDRQLVSGSGAIKVGSKVMIVLGYNLDNKTWHTTKVTVIVDKISTNQASGSAGLKK